MAKKSGDWYDGQWRGKLPDGKGEAKIDGKTYKGSRTRGACRTASAG